MPVRTNAAAVAQRTAIAAALWHERNDRYLGTLPVWSRAALTDDLCRLLRCVESAGVSDVALAQAVTEESEAARRLARVMYGARLLLRKAGFQPQEQGQRLGWDGSCDAVTAPAAARVRYCSDLRSAFDAFRAASVRRVLAPRRLVEALQGRDSGRGAVARLLAAAYSQDPGTLVPALCAAPYRIDAAALRFALAGIQEKPSARAALAAAVGELSGGAAREAAVAALATLDAAHPAGEKGFATVAAAAKAAETAMRAFARTSDARFEDPEFAALLDAAAHADRVWTQVADPPGMEARIANLRELLSSTSVSDDLELCVGSLEERGVGSLVCEDGTCVPTSLVWSALASALDLDGAAESPTEAVQVFVTVPLSRALAAFLADLSNAERAAAGADGVHVWSVPEEAIVFTAPAMTFSASRLNAFVKCPRRWFYDYLCQVLEDPASLQAAYGKVVHDALEALHRKIRVPSRHDQPVILDQLLRELDNAFGASRAEFDSQLEYEVSRARARRIAEQYVRWLAAEAARAPMEIVHVELLERRRFGGHDFVGYIDRVDRPLGGGPVTIFDYKTGRIDADARAYLEKVRRGDEAQLALYYAMRNADGDDVARIALVSVRDPRDEVWILALDVVADETMLGAHDELHDGVLRARCSRADLDASLRTLVARCDQLTTQGLGHFDPGDDPPCGYCAYARACRERPKDGERIFAR